MSVEDKLKTYIAKPLPLPSVEKIQRNEAQRIVNNNLRRVRASSGFDAYFELCADEVKKRFDPDPTDPGKRLKWIEEGNKKKSTPQ